MAFVKRTQPEIVEQDERRRERDFDGLCQELDDPNPVARRWAARDLARHAQAAPTLLARLGHEEDPAVREAIITSLTEIGDEATVAGLIDCLRSDDAALRNEAIESLKLLPDVVAPLMTGLLEDDDPDVRIFAVNVLESLRHPDVEHWLIKVISADPHVNVCATAVDLLGEVGTDAAIEPLEGLKARFAGEPYIEFAADLALRRIADEG